MSSLPVRRSLASIVLLSVASSAQYTATYYPSATGLPQTTEQGQSGTNDCGTTSSQTSMCQNLYMNDITDFCVWAPAPGGEVANFEAEVISYCTQAGRGTRVIPEGTIQGAHFIYSPSYVQVTGTGDFTKIGITAGDEGGELDPHGATGVGNPVGGVVFVNGVQTHEWFSFMSATQFCTRACYDGNRATSLCRHTYDVLGCDFNAPGNYAANQFESCDGADAEDIMYNYPGLTTFVQNDTSDGVAVPSPHPAPASSNCNYVSANALAGSTATGFGGGSSSSSSSSSSTSSATATSASSMTTSSVSITVVTAPTLSSDPFGSGSAASDSSSSSSSSSSASTSKTEASVSGGASLFSSQGALPIALGLGAVAVFVAAF